MGAAAVKQDLGQVLLRTLIMTPSCITQRRLGEETDQSSPKLKGRKSQKAAADPGKAGKQGGSLRGRDLWHEYFQAKQWPAGEIQAGGIASAWRTSCRPTWPEAPQCIWSIGKLTRRNAMRRAEAPSSLGLQDPRWTSHPAKV